MNTRIIELSRAQTATAIEWAAAEGWNPGLGDLEAFLAADPHGFYGLTVDGELAATISAVRYGEAFAFIGFFICRPGLRGRCLGLALWNDVLARLATRSVGLDGVLAQIANYAKSGFVLAHRNVRYGGTPALTLPVGADGLRRLTVSDIPAVVTYERAHRLFPADRADFLRAWLTAPGTVAYVRENGGALAGYGAIRPCRQGFKIGPLFAGTKADAAAIARALIAQTKAAPVFLDVPEVNADAVALAKWLGLAPVFETARMYRGQQPDLNLAMTFGITSFELG